MILYVTVAIPILENSGKQSLKTGFVQLSMLDIREDPECSKHIRRSGVLVTYYLFGITTVVFPLNNNS